MRDDAHIEYELEEGMRQLGLYQPADKLAKYVSILHKWNQVYNLTAVRDKHLMVARHILDSLAISRWVKGYRVLDVGSGAGLPGIPLALVQPERHVVVLDSQHKRIMFLEEVKRMLSIRNIEVVHARVEDYHPDRGFDTVVSRAFSDLSQLMHWTEHLLAPYGIWLAMKGRRPDAELAAITYPYDIETYKVPGVEGERCCIIIKKDSSWPK